MSDPLAVWRAARPNFLILAPLCAGLGIALAWQQGLAVSPIDLVLILLAATLAHAAVNLLNEYDDFRSGLDLITRRTPFSGGSGALPETPSAARAVARAGFVLLAFVVAIGGYFLWLRGWPLLVLGAVGATLVITYTRWLTRSPLMCLLAPGLGFGPVMVLGALLALGGEITATAILCAALALVLASELLLINQLPDVEADQQIGRHHLAIVLGQRRAAHVAGMALIGAFGLLMLGLTTAWLPLPTALALLPLPVAFRVAWHLPGAVHTPAHRNRLMGANVAVLLATLALLLIGLSL